MTALVANGGRALRATGAKQPEMSAGLARAVDRALDDVVESLPAFLRPEAEAVAARLAQLAAPASAERILAWLSGVNAGMAAPLDKATFAVRSVAIVEAMAAMPGDVFNAATRAETQIACQFFPGVREVHEALAPAARQIARPLHALRYLLRTSADPEAGGDALSAEQRDAIVAAFHPRFEAAVADVRARLTAPAESRPQPGHVSRDNLRALYSLQAGSEDPAVASIARTRLAALNGSPAASPSAPEDEVPC